VLGEARNNAIVTPPSTAAMTTSGMRHGGDVRAPETAGVTPGSSVVAAMARLDGRAIRDGTVADLLTTDAQPG
jgi:hypothetical protein